MVDEVLARVRTLYPRLIDLSLDRFRRLLDTLGHPERQLPPIVHVAGTNGKGSTVATLRAIAEAAGLRVHTFTSPHLVRFVERIRVAGKLIGGAEITALLEECEAANAGQPITEFEIINAAAFLAYIRTPADLCLLEVGLGGRFDSTNVIENPAVTVITPISMDHEAFLGDTLAKIAFEKAGIIKPGVTCVVSRQESEALAVIKARAAELSAPLLVQDEDWTATETPGGMRFQMGATRRDLPRPALGGGHQIINAGAAIAVALQLRLDAAAIPQGLRAIDWPARLQPLATGKLAELLPAGWELWLDGAHNPGGATVLAEAARGWADRPLYLVSGMLSTHDAGKFLTHFAGLAREMRGVAIPGAPATRSAEEMAGLAGEAGLKAQAMDGVVAALEDLATLPGPARVLICGSLYLAGHVLGENGTVPQ